MTNTQNRDESRGCISVAWKSVRGYGCLYVCLCHPGACRGLEAQHTLQSYTRRPDHGHNTRPDRQNSEYDGPRQQDDESYVCMGRGEIAGVNLDDGMPVPNIWPSEETNRRVGRIPTAVGPATGEHLEEGEGRRGRGEERLEATNEERRQRSDKPRAARVQRSDKPERQQEEDTTRDDTTKKNLPEIGPAEGPK